MNQVANKASTYALLVSAIMAVAACTTVREVDEVQDAFNSENFQQVASHPIKCEATEEGCNKVYLLKGEACLRVNDLDCAVDKLTKGIALTSDWSAIGQDAARFHGNLCEALRDRRDEATSGAAAEGDFARLRKCANNFAMSVPDHIGAVYWTQLVAFEQAKGLDGADACTPLNAVAVELTQAEPKAAMNQQYAAPFEALVAGVTSERHNRQCQ